MNLQIVQKWLEDVNLVVMDPSDAVEVWDCPYVLISESVIDTNFCTIEASTSGKESGSGHWKLSVTGTMFVSICKAVDSSRRKLSSSSTSRRVVWIRKQQFNKRSFQTGFTRRRDASAFKNEICLTRSNALGGRIRRKWRMSWSWWKILRFLFKRKCLKWNIYECEGNIIMMGGKT